jgi:2-keto-4-pentenoate hydratase/2-oxohepta-3-ene-1,7-dioic acid hydratase in catechol pathway
MRFLSFKVGDRESWGAVVDNGVVDLNKAFSRRYATLTAFIASADYSHRDQLDLGKTDYSLAEITYLPVIPRPEKICCLVRNYLDHHNEVVASGLKRELSKFPPIFLRVWRSTTAHNQPIIRPRESETLDWEGELAMIVGTAGRRIPEEQAMSHIAGYSVFNDASIREWQFHAQQIAAGKNFASTGGFGPWMVTSDEVPNPEQLKIQTRLNGEVVQSSDTSHLIFKLPRIINYCSTIFELVPGDVIVTGTPAGVGWSRKPPRFMKGGDVVEVEIEKVGTLRNPVEND